MNAVTRLLRDLVAIPSVNPRLLGPDVETPAEEPVAEYLSVLAKKHGLDVSRQAVLPGRRNLLVRLKPSGKVKKRILLAPHMDVVPADDSQFKPSISNGRLYGRGACDTKGCIAAYFHALCQIAKYKQRLQHTEIIFLGLIDEEHLQSGSRAYARNGQGRPCYCWGTYKATDHNCAQGGTFGGNSRWSGRRPTEQRPT